MSLKLIDSLKVTYKTLTDNNFYGFFLCKTGHIPGFENIKCGINFFGVSSPVLTKPVDLEDE